MKAELKFVVGLMMFIVLTLAVVDMVPKIADTDRQMDLGIPIALDITIIIVIVIVSTWKLFFERRHPAQHQHDGGGI